MLNSKHIKWRVCIAIPSELMIFELQQLWGHGQRLLDSRWTCQVGRAFLRDFHWCQGSLAVILSCLSLPLLQDSTVVIIVIISRLSGVHLWYMYCAYGVFINSGLTIQIHHGWIGVPPGINIPMYNPIWSVCPYCCYSITHIHTDVYHIKSCNVIMMYDVMW